MRSRSGISIGIVSGWVLWMCVPALGEAESLPASVRACAAETDSLKRLVCYDREVGRYMDAKPGEDKPTGKHEQGSNPPADVTAAGASAAAVPPAAGSAASTPPTAATPPTPTAPSQQAQTGKDASHVSARVVSIDRSPNEMLLHLDNGQVWEQLQSVSGDLSLQVGDTVKIDRRMGTYWLSGPHVSGMKVRQKS